MSCRGPGLSDFVVEGSQAGESQVDSLQALAHAAGELHAREHLQQVASVAPSGSARPRRAAAPLPGVCEGHDVEIKDSASKEYGAKQGLSELDSLPVGLCSPNARPVTQHLFFPESIGRAPL